MENAQKKHILIVDDDPASRRLFGALLARVGYEVLYGKDGNDGIEMVRRFHPDLILLDFYMPVMDGMEAAGRLKDDPDPTIARIPVILLTNEDLSIEAQKAAKESGIDAYMQKGMDDQEFISQVTAIINPTTP